MKPPKTKVIYEPTGPAREYTALAVNLRIGCDHGCLYCYGPRAAHKKRDEFHANIRTRSNILAFLERDATLLEGDRREILLSFFCDPYSLEEPTTGLTREALKILINHRLSFTVLTKGGTRACRDFDLLADYPKTRFGSTIVLMDQTDADHWEPNAASIKDRIKAIRTAHKKGIRTWVSLEPVIDPAQAIEIVRELHPIVGHWKIGKLNYCKEAHDVDWRRFRTEITELLDSFGADYYLKNSLARA